MPAKKELNANEIYEKAMARAFRGGVAGAAAMGIQVCSLMWMRTTMNYQYRNGEPSTLKALKVIYEDGGKGLQGIRRFYRGIGPALAQGPLSRFGDTAANSGMLALLDSMESTADLHVSAKTGAASMAAAGWRICLMPIDAMKTISQVEGKGAIRGALMNKVRANGIGVLWHGALGAYSATLAGHYPWFFVNNFLEERLPKAPEGETGQKLLRSAGIGFCASITSDTISNSLRVLKTVRQTSKEAISYPDAAKQIIAKDGVIGLFGRGLKTRIISNGMQGIMFKVLWKLFEEKLNKGK